MIMRYFVWRIQDVCWTLFLVDGINRIRCDHGYVCRFEVGPPKVQVGLEEEYNFHLVVMKVSNQADQVGYGKFFYAWV